MLRVEIFCAPSLAYSRTALSTKSPGLPYTALAAGTIASTMGAMKPGSFGCIATTSQANSTAPPRWCPRNEDQRRSQMLCHTIGTWAARIHEARCRTIRHNPRSLHTVRRPISGEHLV